MEVYAFCSHLSQTEPYNQLRPAKMEFKGVNDIKLLTQGALGICLEAKAKDGCNHECQRVMVLDPKPVPVGSFENVIRIEPHSVVEPQQSCGK